MTKKKLKNRNGGKSVKKKSLPDLSPAVSPLPLNADLAPKNQKIKAIFLGVLNTLLLAVLVFLLVYGFFERNTKFSAPRLVSSKQNQTAVQTTADEPENRFLDAALNLDESGDYRIFNLAEALQSNVSTDDLLPLEPMEQFSTIDELNLSDKELYNLYEEKLPENIITTPQQTVAPHQPMIAIVIDDMGVSPKRTRDISSLKYPISVSFLTYANNLKSQIAYSQANGQEIMAHLPMEPQVMQNFTPLMLTTAMSDKEVSDTLNQMLRTVPEAKAVNNHMGSRFTEDRHRMKIVMKIFAERRIAFLDSKTTPHSVGPDLARKYGVELTMRNVFLDNEDNFDYITRQLQQTEKIARAHGYAIAIGHPKAQTYQALKVWLPKLEQKGLKLIPLSRLSAIINH